MKIRTACVRDYGPCDIRERGITVTRRMCFRVLMFSAVLSLIPAVYAQAGRGGASAPNTKATAPTDFTGQWMSVITEDWRYRMITPKKGDYAGVPLNPAARKVADNWDPAKDEAAREECKAYGVANVMRMPGRIRISWADDDTLKVETGAGMQTRMLYFKETKAQGGDWQGISQASWEIIRGSGGAGGAGFGGLDQRQLAELDREQGEVRQEGVGRGGRGDQDGPILSGSLKVVTTKMRPGYLRKNGVPYGDTAVVTEYYSRIDEPNGDSWLVVKTIVEDPTYLVQPFINSSHFKKQNDQSGWNPTPCSAR